MAEVVSGCSTNVVSNFELCKVALVCGPEGRPGALSPWKEMTPSEEGDVIDLSPVTLEPALPSLRCCWASSCLTRSHFEPHWKTGGKKEHI